MKQHVITFSLDSCSTCMQARELKCSNNNKKSIGHCIFLGHYLRVTKQTPSGNECFPMKAATNGPSA